MSKPAADLFDERVLLPLLDSLYSPVVADVLDGLGYRRQVLSPYVRALTPVLPHHEQR